MRTENIIIPEIIKRPWIHYKNSKRTSLFPTSSNYIVKCSLLLILKKFLVIHLEGANAAVRVFALLYSTCGIQEIFRNPAILSEKEVSASKGWLNNFKLTKLTMSLISKNQIIERGMKNILGRITNGHFDAILSNTYFGGYVSSSAMI